MEAIQELIKIIKNSNNIVFFGGAGVSVESKIPDFRSADGLYNDKNYYQPEQILSHTFFQRYPEKFYDFYKNKMIYLEAKPNPCHIALAKLEHVGKLKAIVTQNIDNLHYEAGSKKVFELHGSEYRNYCTKCHKFFDIHYITNSNNVPLCDKCGGIVKPDVVLYEESLDMNILGKSIDYISQAEVLIIGGTSLSVYPAANLINYFRGDKVVIINKSVTSFDKKADLVIAQNIGEVFTKVMEELDL